jgi:hypothetical protein
MYRYKVCLDAREAPPAPLQAGLYLPTCVTELVYSVDRDQIISCDGVAQREMAPIKLGSRGLNYCNTLCKAACVVDWDKATVKLNRLIYRRSG